VERQFLGKKLQKLVWMVRGGKWNRGEEPYVDFKIKVDFRKLGTPSGTEQTAKNLAAMVEDVDSESVALELKQVKKIT
jgi:hypothetical protein